MNQDTPKSEEELRESLNEAIVFFKNKQPEQAKACIEAVLAADPDHLDAHILAAGLHPFNSDEFLAHLAFVMDKDITHVERFESSGDGRGFVVTFLSSLQLRMYDAKKEDRKRAVAERIIHYCIRLLEARSSIPSVHDFAEALIEVERFDDVILLGRCLAKEVAAETVGWPGLAWLNDYMALDEIIPLVINAFFFAGKHDEGCRWILGRLKATPADAYLWYSLGESLCSLGYPEETARAWIISLTKGGDNSEMLDHFESLVRLVCDPYITEKTALRSRLWKLKRELPPEMATVYKEVSQLVGHAVHDEQAPPPDEKYIESRLGRKLPSLKVDSRTYLDERLIPPTKRSTDPVVREAIDMMDALLNAETRKEAQHGPGQKGAEASKARQKVAVGAGLGPSGPALALMQFGIDVTARAAEGDMPPIVGRDREIERMIRILVRAEKNNPILLGEAGVGKTAVVHGLAQRIAAGNVPAVLRDRRVIELNVGVLVAGTTYRGDFEQRITNIVKETREDPRVILFIDELHTLIGAGDRKGGLDASNIVKPALASGDLRLIGATTAREFSRTIERDAALERRFSPVWLQEIDQAMTLAVLRARRPLWEKHHGVAIADDILGTAVQLTDQYIRHRHFPDKAIDLIDEVCALIRTTATEDGPPPEVTREHLRRIVDEWAGAGTSAKGLPTAGFIDEIGHQLRRHITGHEPILDRLCELVADEKLGLRLSKRPRVLYFRGKPDTGKTECARALASVLWPGEKERFLLINMGRMADPSHLSRLIGAPAGYVGSDNGGTLSMHLKQYPFSVIYLENFHQAHEKVQRFFANLFLEGAFPDAQGRTVFTGSAIFILSATLKGEHRPLGFSTVRQSQAELTTFLERERVPKAIAQVTESSFWFDPLDETRLGALIERRLSAIAKQPGIRDFGIQFDAPFIDDLVKRYQKSPPDARDLKRLLNRHAYPYLRERLSEPSDGG